MLLADSSVGLCVFSSLQTYSVYCLQTIFVVQGMEVRQAISQSNYSSKFYNLITLGPIHMYMYMHVYVGTSIL